MGVCWLAVPASLAVGAGVVPVSYEPLWGWLLFYEWAAACFCLIMGAQLRHSFLAGVPPLQRPCRSGAVQHPCGFCTASAKTRLWCSSVAWSWAVPAALGQCIAAAFRHTAPQLPSQLGAGVCGDHKPRCRIQTCHKLLGNPQHCESWRLQACEDSGGCPSPLRTCPYLHSPPP